MAQAFALQGSFGVDCWDPIRIDQMKSSGKTKVVLRHIPAFVDEKSFSDAISAFIPLLDWVQFVKAKK